MLHGGLTAGSGSNGWSMYSQTLSCWARKVSQPIGNANTMCAFVTEEQQKEEEG